MSNKSSEIQVLGSSPNAVVVRLSNRNFPGVVIQGDTLKNVANLLASCTDCLKKNDLEEAHATLDELGQIIAGVLSEYERIVGQDNVPWKR